MAGRVKSRVSIGVVVALICAASLVGAEPNAHAAGTGQYGRPEWLPLRHAAGGGTFKNGCTYLSPYAPENICDDDRTGALKYHPWWALDLMVAKGSPVYAAGAGKASLHPLPNSSGYGNYIEVDHGKYGRTLYGHLSAFKVSNGAWVDQNTRIGLSGNSGTFAYHLHFEKVNQGGRFGRSGTSVDPGALKACHGTSLTSYPQEWRVPSWKGMHWGVHKGGYSDGTYPSCGAPRNHGDLSGDGIVNITDLSILLTHWAPDVHIPRNTGGDVNGSGTVDIYDLSILLTHYGDVSP
jgi:hypothetical protein